MKKENWIWMPHPGHFICDYRCRFHLNTYIGGYIVSTVGEYVPDTKQSEEYEDIGCDRKYETMVFKAQKSDNKCCPYRRKNGDDLDFAGYNTSDDAYIGHLKICRKWAKKGDLK